jgi:hypothetical protein
MPITSSSGITLSGALQGGNPPNNFFSVDTHSTVALFGIDSVGGSGGPTVAYNGNGYGAGSGLMQGFITNQGGVFPTPTPTPVPTPTPPLPQSPRLHLPRRQSPRLPLPRRQSPHLPRRQSPHLPLHLCRIFISEPHRLRLVMTMEMPGCSWHKKRLCLRQAALNPCRFTCLPLPVN